MTARWLLLATLLGSCDAAVPTLPTCHEAIEGFSRRGYGVAVFQSGVPQLDVEEAGIVTQLGTGIPEDITIDAVEYPEPHQWFRFRSESGEEYVVFAAGIAAVGFGIDEGQHVVVEHRDDRRGEFFSPIYKNAVVRGDTDEPVFWYAQGGELERVEAPSGFAIDRGAAMCVQDDECGAFSGYALEVTTPDGDTTVRYASSARIGRFEVTHLDALYELPNQPGPRCPDYYVSRFGSVIRSVELPRR